MAGQAVFEGDSPNRSSGPEPLEWVAAESTTARLQAIPFSEDECGEVTLRVKAFEERATEELQRRANLSKAYGQAWRLRMQGDHGGAVEGWQAALPELQALGLPTSEALWRLGEDLAEQGLLERARPHFETAVEEFEALGDALGGARAQSDLGDLHFRQGRFDEAEAAHEQALILYRRAESPKGEATALSNLVQVLVKRGDFSRALELMQQAADQAAAAGNARQQALIRERRGRLLAHTGDRRGGLEELEKALEALRPEGGKALAGVLLQTGWVKVQSGDLEAGLLLLTEAVELTEGLDDPALEAALRDRRGTALRLLGRFPEARLEHEAAYRLQEILDSPLDRSHLLSNLGWLDLDQNRIESALANLAEASDKLAKLGDASGAIYSQIGLGRALAADGELVTAERHLADAVRKIEAQRETLDQSLSRSYFLDTRFLAYEAWIDVLARLHDRSPEAGFDRQAFAAAERARSVELRRDLSDSRSPASETEDALRALQQKLDSKTVLVAFHAANPESLAWVMDRDHFTQHRLAGQESLDPLVRGLFESLQDGREGFVDPHAENQLATLADKLLRDLEPRLAGFERLLLVRDGPLHYVPFAALALPTTGARLFETFEVIDLPAASLAASEGAPPTAQSPSIAVLADPVFQASDERLGNTQENTPDLPERVSRLVESLDLEDLVRLRETRREAEAIRRLAPESTRVWMDFAASPEALSDPRVQEADVFHVATHGLIDPRHPLDSGFVLSLVDPEGQPQEGLVAVDAIAALELRADLVVVSACSTGLGHELRGEGLVGLRQAFHRAGARQVLLTLWPVDDRATADFMEHFYRFYLEEDLSAAVALGRAQGALHQDPRWTSPSFWAPFFLTSIDVSTKD